MAKMWRTPRARHQLKVILVDDDDLRSAVKMALEEDGHLVLQARDGLEAMARMRGLAGRVLALVDLAMPRMDGRALIRAMKADPALATIPVVVWTSSHGVEVPGAAAVLGKPISLEALLAVVEEHGAERPHASI